IYWQQFRTADGDEPGPTWTQWGTRSDISELATGTMDQICARYTDGTADCAGLVCGFDDELQHCPTFSSDAARVITDAGGGLARIWIDTSGMVHRNDARVFRESNSRSECVVV